MVRQCLTAWQELYHEGYFHGTNSGYPAQGYENAHPTWEAYIRFIHDHRGDGLHWLDLGCAHGYLLGEAGQQGMAVCGLDVSEYALRMIPEQRGRLGLANAEVLPVRTASCDVVTAFDLAEHLHDPQAMLREAWRVLKPAGLMWLGTPDPLTFHRVEETHVSEQPPATWLVWLLEVGFEVALRFYAEEFNLEVLAVKPPVDESARRILRGFGKDYLGAQTDILRSPAQPSLQCVLHKGWSPLNGTRSLTTSGSIYLLNTSERPLAITVDVNLGSARDLQLIVDDQRVGFLSGERSAAEFAVLPGGHEVTLLAGEYQQVEVREITIEAVPTDYATHNLQLPFDQYQRYRSLSDTVAVLRAPEDGRVRLLDVGGHPGQILGFLPDDEVTVVDLQAFDSPRSFRANGLALPFSESSYDVVTSVDVLEHLQVDVRPKFLEELWRVAERHVVLSGPFRSRDVTQAEEILFEFIKFRSRVSHQYLTEHAQNGLPEASDVEDFFRSKGAVEVIRIPNTPLTVWLLTMGAYFYLDANPQLNHVSRKLTRFLNELSPSLDASDHYYRQLILASKVALSDAQRESIRRLVHQTHEKPFDFSPVLTMLSLFSFQLQEEKERDYQQRLNHSETQHRATIQSHQEQIERIMADRRSWQEQSHKLELAKLKVEEQMAGEMNRYEEQARAMSQQMSRYEEQARAMSQQISDLNSQRHLAQSEFDKLQLHFQRLQQHEAELTQQIHRLEQASSQKDAQLLHQAEVIGQQAQQLNNRLVARLFRLIRRLDGGRRAGGQTVD